MAVTAPWVTKQLGLGAVFAPTPFIKFLNHGKKTSSIPSGRVRTASVLWTGAAGSVVYRAADGGHRPERADGFR